MSPKPRVTLIPLVGPFHTRFPLYNVVHVREVLQAVDPEVVALGPLPQGSLAQPYWQSTEEVALPHTVVPWALKRGVPMVEVASVAGAPGEPGEAADAEEFDRFLAEFEQGRAQMREVEATLTPVEALLRGGLDLTRILTELLPAIEAHDLKRRELYGEGPGTGWLLERAARVAERIMSLPFDEIALLIGVDDYSAVAQALAGTAELPAAPLPAAASEAGRTRALLDLAMRGDADDVDGLIGRLRQVDTAEARYHEANLLLTSDRAEEAFGLLKRVSQGDFSEPYYLPGFLLARLGQLFDLAGERDDALRAYRGVLALSYAPPEAADVAVAGLKAPFEWAGAPAPATSAGG